MKEAKLKALYEEREKEFQTIREKLEKELQNQRGQWEERLKTKEEENKEIKQKIREMQEELSRRKEELQTEVEGKKEQGMGPAIHWMRKTRQNWETVIEGITKPGTVAAVFATKEKAIACFEDIVDADFGLSVNISTSVDNARHVGNSCGIKRHSVEYTLGFNDPHNHLPNSQVLGLSTMCGHGMVSFNLAKKMMDMVREGRRTPRQAAETLMRFCPCGVYNPDRAKRLFEEAIREQR